MKGISEIMESEEQFDAIVQIDLAYFELNNLYEVADEMPTQEYRETLIGLFERLIKNKKIVQWDYSTEEFALNQIIEVGKKFDQERFN